MSSAPSTSQKAHNLFQVFLRLRPPPTGAAAPVERFLTVEEPGADDVAAAPTHITLNPPNDRRRAIERFAFTRVFEEDATQLDVFHCTGVVPLVEGVLAAHGGDGTDALLATLGVTGSGKSHTILGSKSQRGLTQLALDVLYRSLGHSLLDCASHPELEASLNKSEPSEASVCSASAFLESAFSETTGRSRASSRAPTPMLVKSPNFSSPSRVGINAHIGTTQPCSEMESTSGNRDSLRSLSGSPKAVPAPARQGYQASSAQSSHLRPPDPPSWHRFAGASQPGLARPDSMPKRDHGVSCQPVQQSIVSSLRRKLASKHFVTATASTQRGTNTRALHEQGESMGPPPPTPSRRLATRPSALPQQPDVSALSVACDPSSEYAVVMSMYEVYNDRIFDLLSPPIKSAATKEYRRRPLLFKPTESSPDRKVVAGLRKVICGSLHQALMVLEAGLHERRVAGTGSNSASSRSHGFICVEVKKRPRPSKRHSLEPAWGGSTLTIVDLAGSERARDAKTAGVTLAEAGKINESLMYLGQCLQMQSDATSKDKPGVVPFRQCKLTELLFSNSFPSASSHSSSTATRRNPQRAAMVVTADPHGDFNATSQILRYSAVAREITVPRVPSLTRTVLSAANTTPDQPRDASLASTSPPPDRSSFLSGPTERSSSRCGAWPTAPGSGQRAASRSSGSGRGDDYRSTMELAALEIARLSEEVDYLRQVLQAEQSARTEAEAHLLSMEDKMIELEQVIREDCTTEFERRLEMEMARWRASMQVEMERGEEHWGRKIEVFERTMGAEGAHERDADPAGGEDKENVLVEDVGQENERLRRDNEILRRELAAMSPTKRVPLRERPGGSDARAAAASAADMGSPRPSRARASGACSDDVVGGGLQRRMERLRVCDDADPVRTPAGAGTRKMRKLTAKRWDSALDEDELF